MYKCQIIKICLEFLKTCIKSKCCMVKMPKQVLRTSFRHYLLKFLKLYIKSLNVSLSKSKTSKLTLKLFIFYIMILIFITYIKILINKIEFYNINFTRILINKI